MTVDDRLGHLDVHGESVTMTFRRRLPYPIEAVWNAITDPDARETWFGTTTIEPLAGGAIAMLPHDPPVPPDAKRMTGTILTWQPPSGAGNRTAVLEHEWHQRIVEAGVVRYELTEDGDATVLVFTHHGLGLRNAQGFLPGTHAFLDRLTAHLAAEDIPNWNRLYELLAPAYR
ncbi:Uncharacterized conserved protein YndB, AHSA1/START domain [Asanoa hainanensis]|uniref:Uncharacterized conserved protein YndB, AHSA1/START domain n=1 Tax=Asanoa hainanensis TaxID=560556 RepID=A0A239GB24_9ACTN|nr:SRPBCC family protein [Asanoa hainanensis]SNS65998.1 Uncharacterized conserved protein YndB, AHSA1/START domain [Asanoa hainanensis]